MGPFMGEGKVERHDARHNKEYLESRGALECGVFSGPESARRSCAAEGQAWKISPDGIYPN